MQNFTMRLEKVIYPNGWHIKIRSELPKESTKRYLVGRKVEVWTVQNVYGYTFFWTTQY